MARKTNGITITTAKKKAISLVRPPVLAGVQGTARLEEEIRRRAYELYLQRNGSPGDEHQDWLIAEREILARHQQQHRV
jgi:hypothetical protein